MSLVRVVFLGTPQFACASLESLIKDEQFEVVGVVTQPDRKSGRKMQLKACPVKELALANGLPVLSPESVNTEESLKTIKSWNAEAAVVVAFGQLMSQKFLDLFPQKVVNIHGSLLPRWRGAAPIQRAIMAGDKKTGVALQVMVKKLDAGDVIGTRVVELNDTKTALELHDELAQLGTELLHVEFLDYLQGKLKPTPQDESKVSIAPKIDKAEGLVDFNRDAIEVHRQILGLTMGPGSYSFFNGKKTKIHKTQLVSQNEDDSKSSQAPGSVLELGNSIKVQCGQGVLEIIEIQPESRPRMSAADFVKGYRLEIGHRFGS